MKITVIKILSIASDGASCYLLTMGQNIKILLDCGISQSFDLGPYLHYRELLKSVTLVLISHSSLQHSGALPFLLSQLDLNPKIIFTTQPVMRYSPLNIHDHLLSLRQSTYTPKIFNDVYSFYQGIQLVKPYQRKVVQVMEDGDVKGNVHFTCFQAGGALGSLAWRISTGLLTILYLVDYNNYFLNHINGLDLQAIKAKPVDLILTDMYPQIPDEKFKKDKLYMDIKRTIVDFYCRNGMDPCHPKQLMTECDKKLLLTCDSGQNQIQVMICLKKVLNDLQQVTIRQKIGIIHLSSRYLQLIKSQVQHFSDQTKLIIDKIDEYFVHQKTLAFRLNIGVVQHVYGVLNKYLAEGLLVEIVHFGRQLGVHQVTRNIQAGRDNVKDFKLFRSQMYAGQKIQSGQGELTKLQQKLQQQQLIQKKFQKIQQQQPDVVIKSQKQPQPCQLSLFKQISSRPQSLVGKYLSQISFPHFTKSHKQQQFQYNDYGMKHHLEMSGRPNKKTIQDFVGLEMPELGLVSKKSTVQVMNIQFGIDQKLFQINQPIRTVQMNASRTNFNSSLKVIQVLNPKNVLFLNCSSSAQQSRLFNEYKSNLKSQCQTMSQKVPYKIQLANQLLCQKINYLSLTPSILHKIHGHLSCSNNQIQLHISLLQQKQVLQFRLEKFFKLCKENYGKKKCRFVGNGVIICGISIYRLPKEIVMQGSYSQHYFIVRKLLYQFLGIR